MSKKFVLFLRFVLLKIPVSVATGHPVYLRAAYATARRGAARRGAAERAAVCDLAETCARLCTRVRV